MLIHHILCSGAQFHNLPIIRFFRGKCVEMGTHWCDHRFYLLNGPSPEEWQSLDDLELKPGQVVVATEASGDIYRILRTIPLGDCVILHAAFFSWRFWLRLACRPRLCRRTAWVMWGGDINNMKEYANRWSLRGSVYLKLARIVVPRLGAVSALAPGDYDIVRNVFGAQCNHYVRAIYPLVEIADVAPEDIGSSRSSRGETLRVLLGNSADPSNCHLEALNWLSRYRKEDVEVVCPLTYGGSTQYRDEVVEAGHRALGGKFRPFQNMLSREDFFKLLDGVDVLVFNQRRQQGLASVYYLLSLGKKVYLRHDAPTFPMLRDFGIVVNDSCSLSTESFSNFSAPLPAEVNAANAKRCCGLFSPRAAAEGWKCLFEMLRRENAIP